MNPLAFDAIVTIGALASLATIPLLIPQLTCLVRGHEWRVLRCSYKHNLWHLHPMAGQDADCARCGKQWRDWETTREIHRKMFGPSFPPEDCFACVDVEPVTEGRYR